MKLKVFAASFALVLALGLTCIAAFAPPGFGLNYPLPLSPGMTVTGPITNIDSVNRMIQIKDQDGIIQEVRIDPSVRILQNGTPTRFSDLFYGDTITLIRK